MSNRDPERAALQEAREDGLISVTEYLAELRKLREPMHPAAGSAGMSSAAAANEYDAESRSEDEELVDEDGLPYERLSTPARRHLQHGPDETEALAPDSAPSAQKRRRIQQSDSDDSDMDRRSRDDDDSPRFSDFSLSPEHVPEATLSFEIGAICTSTISRLANTRLTVLRVGTSADFVNEGRIYVRYQALKKG